MSDDDAGMNENDDADREGNDDADRDENDDADRDENNDADRGENDDADRGENDDADRGENDDADREGSDDADRGESDDADREGSDDTDRDENDDGTTSADDGSYPIEGTALVKTAALASVPAGRVPALLARVQTDIGSRIDEYRRRYERIATQVDREAFLVEPDHWDGVADRIGLSDRERDAVVRAHEAEVERIGSGSDRREEFETALEIRSGVVIGVDEGDDDVEN